MPPSTTEPSCDGYDSTFAFYLRSRLLILTQKQANPSISTLKQATMRMNLLLGTIVREFNSEYTCITKPFKVHFNIILRSPSWPSKTTLFRSWFPKFCSHVHLTTHQISIFFLIRQQIQKLRDHKFSLNFFAQTCPIPVDLTTFN